MMYPLSSEGLNKETDTAIYFFSPAFDPLNNFSAHTVDIWGKRFMTSEHAYHWKKFEKTAPNIAEMISEAGSPEKALQLAKKERKSRMADWDNQKLIIMEEILKNKLAQHEDVEQILRKSGTREIIENSPVDDFWGNGPNKNGFNHLGRIWMKLRDELQLRH